MDYELARWRRAQELPLECPECGQELGFRDEIFTYEGGDCVAGCSRCLRAHDAAEWLAPAEGQAVWGFED